MASGATAAGLTRKRLRDADPFDRVRTLDDETRVIAMKALGDDKTEVQRVAGHSISSRLAPLPQ